MAGIKELMQEVEGDPYFAAVMNTKGHAYVPAVPYDNRLLAGILRADPRYSGTNAGVNAGAYLDPRYESELTPFDLNIAQGAYYRKYNPERNLAGRMWASTRGRTPEEFVNTLIHENIHANTFEGPARKEVRQDHFLGHSPYLRYELMNMEHEKLPVPLTTEEREAAWNKDSPGEPAAYIGAAEAMLPEGQMPIQEEMNRRGLGALYAHMTTAGPVATRWDPSVIDALKAYIGHDDDTLQHHGPAVTKRVRNYIESELAPEEPYELKGNPKKGKNKGGSVAAIVANNQRLRLRRRR